MPAPSVEASLGLESDHRAANAFQSLAFWLDAKARACDHPAASTAIGLAASQVLSFGLAHRTICRAKAQDGIVDGGAFLGELCAHIERSLLWERSIRLHFVSATIAVPAAVASRLGLIVCELIANAAKHAFPAGRAGRITIILSLTHQPGMVECVVEDDGVGRMTEDPLAAGMGLTVVQLLARQIGGDCAFDFPAEGTRVVLTFGSGERSGADAEKAERAGDD